MAPLAGPFSLQPLSAGQRDAAFSLSWLKR